MKHIASVVAMFIGVTILSNASTRSDVKVLEASENIKYLSQKIAKDYIFYYTHQNKQEIQGRILKAVQNLEEHIKIIALTTKKEKIKQLLDFFAYEKDQMKSILNDELNIDNATTVLDFSESLTEGANRIAKSIQYDFSFEEKMLMRSKNIEYLVEKVTKYYMVLGSNIEKTTINDKMKLAIEKIENNLDKINQYSYPVDINNKKSDLTKLWSINKDYYSKISSLKIPSILLISTDSFKDIMHEITIYHSKTQ